MRLLSSMLPFNWGPTGNSSYSRDKPDTSVTLFRYSAAKLNEGILLFGDAGGSVFCLKFSAITGCLFDLNIGQQIPSGTFKFSFTVTWIV